MKQFLKKNFEIILIIFVVLTFFKGCNDSRKITELRREVKEIKDSVYMKNELDIRLQIEGLKSEKRMIQSTDRKMMDVYRQGQIDNELKLLENRIK